MRDDLDAGEQALVDELRALPSEGGEPDWRALEQAIAAAVGPTVPAAAPWWRAWRWLVPAGAIAVTVLGVITWSAWHGSPAMRASTARPPTVASAPAAVAADEAAEQLDVDDALLGDDPAAAQGMFSVDDLTWVDEADEAELDQVEAALTAAERKRT